MLEYASAPEENQEALPIRMEASSMSVPTDALMEVESNEKENEVPACCQRNAPQEVQPLIEVSLTSISSV